ncbi:DUF4844 domain-containing protein [Chitinophaga sp. CF418]|uniref:DUF4844 domain-containing protein n=1 Tax=Chitinophaga sp. CF418 TaxID=1855287 RepID=UPI0009133EDF|nr:DUF4844 domain-containing protein [Chitinophaga sp. CF418]SHN25019.1 protein of unknown function [Chitinophaga sp. CF418]
MSPSNFDEHVDIAGKLIAFREREKFSDKAWKDRGLRPSERKVSDFLQQIFDECTDQLIELINLNKSKKALRSSLIAVLDRIDKDELDTEEKEYVTELMFELSKILEVDIKSDLNRWLYGVVMATLLKAGGILSSLKGPFTIVNQPCTKCGADLKLVIKRKDPQVPSFSFDVLKCNNCGELNLFDRQPGIKQFSYENATIVAHLERKKFTKEQALNKLEEMKDQMDN